MCVSLCFDVKNYILSYMITRCNKNNYIKECFHKHGNNLYCRCNIRFEGGYFRNGRIFYVKIDYTKVRFYDFTNTKIKVIELYNLREHVYDDPINFF